MAEDHSASGRRPEIPNRLFFRIGEVTKIAGVEAHVLRFWESEFPMLSPRKTAKGQRQYRRKDLETILAIKQLLYDDKYTIAGARRALRENRAVARRAEPEPAATAPLELGLLESPQDGGKVSPPVSRDGLAEIRSGLEQILKLLEP
ncbi:MAG: MerR family transcriptional regulator [Bryobacterales bacterium]|nr:MerR family transcriptional regulator [Bryobacterales bacterium]MDE0261352.1 MerR family transcriptional regulator [Bryobacterales bacterium]MDE0622377.1 MerR family transcriptional regulator [Bryobacterales bacterium]